MGALATAAWGTWVLLLPSLKGPLQPSEHFSVSIGALTVWRKLPQGPSLGKPCFSYLLLIGSPLPAGFVEGSLSDFFPSSYQSSLLSLSPSDLPLLPPVPQKGGESGSGSCWLTSGRIVPGSHSGDFHVYFLMKSLREDTQGSGPFTLPGLRGSPVTVSLGNAFWVAHHHWRFWTPFHFLKPTKFGSRGLPVFLEHHVVRMIKPEDGRGESMCVPVSMSYSVAQFQSLCGMKQGFKTWITWEAYWKCGILDLTLGYSDSDRLVLGPDLCVFDKFLGWFGGSHWLMDNYTRGEQLCLSRAVHIHCSGLWESIGSGSGDGTKGWYSQYLQSVLGKSMGIGKTGDLGEAQLLN